MLATEMLSQTHGHRDPGVLVLSGSEDRVTILAIEIRYGISPATQDQYDITIDRQQMNSDDYH